MSPLSDPYKNFPFRVKWRDRYVAGFAEVSPIPVPTKRAGHLRCGESPPGIGPEGQGTPFFINLEKGISFDLGFEQWVSMVRSYGPATGKGSLLPEYKTPLTIGIFDEKGELKDAYLLSHCWVTEYRAVPSTDAGSHEIVIGHMRLGFDRAVAVLPDNA